MRRTLLKAACSLLLLALVASPAAAQRPVDLRLDLSTQPYYAPYGRQPVDYLGLSQLYSTGNVRGGRHFRGNRNFLEDRYFGGSMTRFYRDSVGVAEITGGINYGPGQPFYSPGSYYSGSTYGSTVLPYGLSYNPALAQPSPLTSVYYVRNEFMEEVSPAQLPGPSALRTFLEERAREEQASGIQRPYVMTPEAAQAAESVLPQLQTYLESAMPALPGQPQLEDSRPGMIPSPPVPGAVLDDTDGRPRGIRPLDYLRWQYGEEGLPEELTQPEPTQQTAPPVSPVGSIRLTDPEAVEDPSEQVTLMKVEGVVVRRAEDLSEKYMTLGRMELEAGAYLPAAEAFSKAARFNAQVQWDARHREAFARLLAGEYFVSAYLLKYSIVEKPDHLRQGFRLTEIVNRPEDWRTAEIKLAEFLDTVKDAPHHAFAMAYLKIFTGRPGEAEPYLERAVTDKAYVEAVKLLREKAMP